MMRASCIDGLVALANLDINVWLENLAEIKT